MQVYGLSEIAPATITEYGYLKISGRLKKLMALNHAVRSHAARSANYSSHALNKH